MHTRRSWTRPLLYSCSSCNKCGCLPVYADDSIYLTSNNDKLQNQRTIDRKFLAIKEFLTDCGVSVIGGKTSHRRLQGSPPELRVQVLKDGQIVYKTLNDRKVCRFLAPTYRIIYPGLVTSSLAIKPSFPQSRDRSGPLYHLRDSIPQKSWLMLANSLTVGKLVYLMPLWGSATPNHLRKAQTVLNFAARFVTKLHRKTRTSIFMSKCGWLNIRDMMKYHSLVHVWKILKWKMPISLYKQYDITDDWLISTSVPHCSYPWHGRWCLWSGIKQWTCSTSPGMCDGLCVSDWWIPEVGVTGLGLLSLSSWI